MQYWGGKGKRARRAGRAARQLGVDIVEPFCGALHLTAQLGRVVYAADNCEALITTIRHVRAGWDPPAEIDRPTWERLRRRADPADPATALAAFGGSYGGRWFAGFTARTYPGSVRSLVKRARSLPVSMEIRVADYREAPPGVAVCDVPFADTTAPGLGDPFDVTAFWAWAEARHDPCLVYEQTAPADWLEFDSYDYPSAAAPRREVVWVHHRHAHLIHEQLPLL